MKRGVRSVAVVLLAVGSLVRAEAPAKPAVRIAPIPPGGVVEVGQPVRFAVSGEAAAGPVRYRIKRAGAMLVGEGVVDVSAAPAMIEARLDTPGTLIATVEVAGVDGQPLRVSAGAAVAPTLIGPAREAPDDFDAFWDAKLAELAAVPMNPQLSRQDSPVAGVEHFTLTLDNVRGTKVRAQLARPTREGKFPALLIVQWAGVYPLPATNVTKRAEQGWLAMNVSAHDLPLHEPEAFYQHLAETTLKNYPMIGSSDRESSYFLRMYLSCRRATEYLASRDDWDGRTLVVIGTSQGGLLSVVAGALDERVSAVLANVPAGCDTLAAEDGRGFGWPYWQGHARGEDAARVMQTSRFFDAVFFAPRVKAPALVSAGLIDVTCPASGVLAMTNRLGGPVERVILPHADHKGTGGTHAPWIERAEQWLGALREGATIPPATRPTSLVTPANAKSRDR